MGSRLNYDDYTVAWIAVLPIEAEAALAVLDKRHEGYFESSRGDDYIYVGGEVNSHNVVIATLPAGQDYGVGSAAALASQVKARFPRIWFALLVGVAAGVPNLSPSDPGKLRDIRLGDVLVSVPNKDGSGIVHYDLGKDTEEGFLPTGKQAEPPAIFRAAIGNIQLTQKRPFHTGNQLAKYLEHLQLSMDDGRFLRPRSETDLLYATSSADAPSSTPSLVIRQPRAESEPTRVWYGNIGSGNTLMRNAQRRDELRDKYDVIGLEMEAAGVANILPVGVIRGVCDYGDAQKNKDWQPYAAGVAAVYAKGILHAIAITAQIVPVVKEDLPLVAWLVPFDHNDELIGRQAELEKLETLLLVPSGNRKVALTGLGGVGKSRLALEFAWRTRLQQPSCSIIWVQGTDLANFERDCLRVGQALSIPQVADAKADVKVLLKQYLCSGKAGEWLLIVDNADDLDLWTTRQEPDGTQVVPLMDHIPSSSQGMTLITTRNHQVAVKMAKKSIVRLSELSGADALSLTKSLLINPDIVDEDEAASTALLEHLANLPLAVVQAAAYINENNVSRIEEYLKLWESTEEAIAELLSEDFEAENRYPELKNPIATTWLISFEHMRSQNPEAAEMLAFLGCLDFKSIPQSLFPFHLFETERLDNQMMKAIGVLTGYAFLHPQQSHEVEPVYDMHRLVHLATRNWLRREGSLPRWSVEAAKRLVKIFPNAYDHSSKELRNLYMPHAEKILATTELANTEVSIDLLSVLGECYDEEGKFAKAVDAQRAVVSWRSAVPDRDDVKLLRSCRLLAVALTAAGKYIEAEIFAKRAVEGLIAVSGKNDDETFEAIYTLAELYREQARYDESETLQNEVLEFRKKELGEEHEDTLHSRSALAIIYANKGLANEAEEHERAVMDIRKRTLGPQHPFTITSMHNLASVYVDQGRWDEAEVMQLAALEAYKMQLGEEHPDTLRAMGSLAATYKKQGRLTDAEGMRDMLFERRKRVLGTDHPDTLTSMFNVAVGLHDAGRQSEAVALMEDCLDLDRQKLGDNHPDTMNCKYELAKMWTKSGRNEDAMTLMEECLRLRKQNLGENHRNTLRTMYELALMLKTAGRLNDAVALMEKCLECEKKVYGESHNDTLFSMHYLAIMLYEGSRRTEGLTLMEKCVKLRTALLGESHKQTLKSKGWLDLWMTELEEEAAILNGEEEWEAEEEEDEEKEENLNPEDEEENLNQEDGAYENEEDKVDQSSHDADEVSDQVTPSRPPASTEQDRGRNIIPFPASRKESPYALPFRVGIRSTTSTHVGAMTGRISHAARQVTGSTNVTHGLERPYHHDQSILETEID